MDVSQKFPKKTVFWKHFIVALQVYEQEFDLYCKLIRDRKYDFSKLLIKTVKRFYKATTTGYIPDDKFLMAIEYSDFEPRDEYEIIARKIVKDLEDLFYLLYEKDIKKADSFVNNIFSIIHMFAELDSDLDEQNMIAKEEQLISDWIDEVIPVSGNKKKKDFTNKKLEQIVQVVFSEEYISSKRTQRPIEKPIKCKMPVLRKTCVDYDYYLKEHKENGFETYDKDDPVSYLITLYNEALMLFYEQEMYNYGYIFSNIMYFHQERHLEGHLRYGMILAYVVGLDEIIPKLAKFSNKRILAYKLERIFAN